MLNKYKYLIMGSNGFIGRSLYERLSTIVKPQNIYTLSKHVSTYNSPNHIECDITNINTLDIKLKDISFDVIIYLIADTTPSRNISDFDNAYKINVQGLKNTLTVVEKNSLVKHFLFFSTCEVYGNNSYEPDEDQATNPISIYSLTKAIAEDLLKFYINQYNFPITILRLSLVYGPNQTQRFLIPEAISTLLNKETFNVTLGEQTRDFIHINDVCDALIKIIKKKAFINETVNISSNEEIKIKDLIFSLKMLLSSDTIINFGALKYRENEIMRYKISNTKIKNKLAWTPKITIIEGLKSIIKNNKGAR